jgi:two-component system nitrate/nitrite response regulator NarL
MALCALACGQDHDPTAASLLHFVVEGPQSRGTYARTGPKWRERSSKLVVDSSLLGDRWELCVSFMAALAPMTTAHRPRHATVLVGQSSLLMEGLAHLLESTDFQVIAHASSVDHLVSKDLPEHEAILLILNVDGGVERATRQIQAFRQLHANSRVAVVTRHSRRPDLALLFQAGAHAYFGENTNPAIFLKTLDLIMLGQAIITGEALDFSTQVEEPRPPPLRGDIPGLSARELEILRGLAHGKSNKTIAGEIGIVEATVKVHVKAILRKIGMNNRTQAAVWARSRGITDGQVLSDRHPESNSSNDG